MKGSSCVKAPNEVQKRKQENELEKVEKEMAENQKLWNKETGRSVGVCG